MVKLPEYHILNFFYDNDGGCALTTLVHGARFHVIVDPDELRDRSKRGKKIRRRYQQLLEQVKEEAEQDYGCHNTAPLFVKEDEDDDDADSDDTTDSGVDVSSRSEDHDEADDHTARPTEALQRWAFRPLAEEFSSKAPKPKENTIRSVQEWYHCPTFFYHLTLSNGKLSAVEDEPDAELNKRIQSLIPTINLPKYIRELDIPTYSASDLTVLRESEGPDPVPLHPCHVKLDGKEYFIKTVDPQQPGPTKRELQVMQKIESENLHHELRVPLLRGLVHFDNDGENKMMGFIMDPISDPTPLTQMLDSKIPEDKRTKWAAESARMVDLLHQHGIVWGDAKGDNFMVDTHDELWIIDFGGSYTEGWVDPGLKETEEGDDQGLRRLVNGLEDPEANTVQPDGDEVMDEAGEQGRDENAGDSTDDKSDKKRKRQHDSENQDDEEEEEGVPPPKQPKKDEQEAADEAQDPIYCYCNQPEGGRMLACDDKKCKKQWFHFECVGIEEAPESKKWFCDDCLAREEWKTMHFQSELHASS